MLAVLCVQWSKMLASFVFCVSTFQQYLNVNLASRYYMRSDDP